MNKKTKIIYWILTGVLCLQMTATGVGDFMLAEQIVENISHVGFPLGLVPFLGILKILGALVLVFVNNLHLKISTYAGMIFYSLGAIYSHIAIDDPIVPYSIPGLIMLLLVVSSYFIWQKHYFPFNSKNIANE